MKIYDTNYGPDTFGRIRMGLITEMFLTYKGYLKPEIGDHLRIKCSFKGVVRDEYVFEIRKISECLDEEDTVLIQIGTLTDCKKLMSSSESHLTASRNSTATVH